MSHNLTRTQAVVAAGQFIEKYVEGGLQWGVGSVEGFLPHRHAFRRGLEERDFYPLTVSHIADVILANAESYEP